MKRFLAAWCVAILLSLCHLTPMAAAQPGEASGNAPILAYYYQWFTPKSWESRQDRLPIGRAVLQRQHVDHEETYR